MKSPRFLAALAMAAVLTTGVTANAAVTDFTQNGGNNPSGQTPTQSANKFEDPAPTGTLPIDANGDIRVDGTFTKIINNFPTPDKDGHYLRVTMPIKMDFTYDVDKNQMTSTDAVIVNNSVEATGTSSQSTLRLEPKKVKMTIVNFEDNTLGTNTITSGVEFVNTVNTTTGSNRKLQLPFQLNIDGGTGNVTNYSIKNIQDNANKVLNPNAKPITPIEIGANSSLTVKLERINGQNTLGNIDLINTQTSVTSHNLKLKFEYDGK